MKIHYLQHVDFETPATIIDWAKGKNHKITSTKFYLTEALPPNFDFDLLIVMGGPMNIYDVANHPYLIEEKKFIKNAINEGKFVLGICLGAQLIADVLGAKVKPNKEKEIGWFPIHAVDNGSDEELNKILNMDGPVFHWHGDTFEIPENGVRLIKSEACDNQAFIYKNRVLALQYHLEMTKESIKEIIKNCKDELVDAPFIQNEERMISPEEYFNYANNKLFLLMDYLEKRSKNID